MNLFMHGEFVLRSGKTSNYKIECDALTWQDWNGIAAAIMEEGLLPPFSQVVGVPRGGIPLATALAKYATGVFNAGHPTLVCEDIVTTGGSAEKFAATLVPAGADFRDHVIGVCFIARGKCPAWIKPLLQMPIQAALTDGERAHLKRLCVYGSNQMSNEGCNDFDVPNTDENWATIEAMGAWNASLSVEDWRKHPDYEPRPKGAKLHTQNWYLLSYLASKL